MLNQLRLQVSNYIGTVKPESPFKENEKEPVEGCKVLSLILGAHTDLDDTANDFFVLSYMCSIRRNTILKPVYF